MIDREELRRVILLEGYTEEQADAFCEWYYGPYGWEYTIDQMAAAFEEIKRAIAKTAELWEEYLTELRDLALDPLPRYEAPRRPPRYAGPQNKGRSWTRQPPRLARSCCRKIRR